MTELWKDKKGSAYMWAAFVLLAMVMLATVVYNGIEIYVNYQAAETELQRAATVTVDGSMKNAAVRDVALDLPEETVEYLFFDNLLALGYEPSGSDWIKRAEGKMVCTLTGLEIHTDGQTMSVTAVLALPLLWKMDSAAVVRIPIQARAAVLYIE